MKLTRLEVGLMHSNCYFLVNEESGEGVLIDCGGDGNEIILAAHRLGIRIVAILLTHGHADHIEGVDRVTKEFSCPVYLHQFDLEYLRRPEFNLSMRIYMRPLVLETEAIAVRDNEKIEACGFTLEVIHTPGHTQGSVCFLFEDMLFTGDTLFLDSVGGDFPPFGNLDTEIESIRSRLFTLPDCTCYPGHGEATTLAYEIKNNMYCRI